MVKTFDITFIGQNAFESLKHHRKGYVHSVFKESVNLLLTSVSNCPSHISLISQDMHPMGLTCPIMPQLTNQLKESMKFYYKNRYIIFPDAHVKLNLLQARLWQRPLNLKLTATPNVIKKNLLQFHFYIESSFQREYLVNWRGYGYSLKKIRKLAIQNCQYVREGNDGYNLDMFLPLVGYGPGLTPAGDDFISGYLLTIRLIDNRLLTAQELFNFGKQYEELDTTFFAESQVKYALLGFSLKSIHEVVKRLVSDEGIPNIIIDRVLGIGATSGYAWLLGLGTALRAVLWKMSSYDPLACHTENFV